MNKWYEFNFAYEKEAVNHKPIPNPFCMIIRKNIEYLGAAWPNGLGRRAHGWKVVGSIPSQVALCILGKDTLPLFSLSAQQYLKWARDAKTAKELLVA